MIDYIQDYIRALLYTTSFDTSLIHKKSHTKDILLGFVKNLYIYLSSNSGEKDRYNTGVSLESLYDDYIEIVNLNLTFNKADISKDRFNYFLAIQLDYLKLLRKEPDSFIYLNDENRIRKLEVILQEINKFSCNNDYFNFKEFKKFMGGFKTGYLSVVEIDIFKNVGKIPKRFLKRRKLNDYKT